MIHFAYDGSINGNWTAHYALRLAAQHSSRSLRLLHVQEARESISSCQPWLDKTAHKVRINQYRQQEQAYKKYIMAQLQEDGNFGKMRMK